MKALAGLVLASALLGLSGCVVAPVEPAPVVYAPPPGLVVVPGRTYFWGGYYHRYYGGGWQHWH
jgi:hypothetical protein